MQEYGANLPSEGAKVWSMTLALEGEAVEWLVTLHNDAPELCNFNQFMGSLQKRFKDPSSLEKNKD